MYSIVFFLIFKFKDKINTKFNLSIYIINHKLRYLYINNKKVPTQ